MNSTGRITNYKLLIKQAKHLLIDEPDLIAALANLSALIKTQMKFLWVGFYFVKKPVGTHGRASLLVLGPFQGDVACTRIPYGKGVCGTAWKEKRTIIVPDVHKFPGHIACSSKSRSEIVVPVFDRKGRVRLALDIDSRKKNDFTETDKTFLAVISLLIGKRFFK